jgi:hypothetical protein
MKRTPLDKEASPSLDFPTMLHTLAQPRTFPHVIAMATHGHSGLQRWVLGSITEREGCSRERAGGVPCANGHRDTGRS